MTGFSDSAYLVSIAYKEGENGREVANRTRRRVFVNPFTMSQAAYQNFDAEGFRPRHLLQMRVCDYQGEEAVEYRGELLSITDVSAAGRGDFVRLTCLQKAADDG